MSYAKQKDIVKGILLDSGKVLNEPVTGHWMITPNFYDYINKKEFKRIPKKKKQRAFKFGLDYISSINIILTEADEYLHFLKHYEIIFKEIKELDLSITDIEQITKDLVFNYDKYRFYPDALKVIPDWFNNYKLAIVSDAWPSLINVFEKAGMRKYFSSLVISSMIGVSKPDSLMYTSALEEMELQAEEVIFVDDNIFNCNGAKAIGISRTYLLCRDIRLYLYYKIFNKDHIVIRSLRELDNILANG